MESEKEARETDSGYADEEEEFRHHRTQCAMNAVNKERSDMEISTYRTTTLFETAKNANLNKIGQISRLYT